MSRSHWLRFVGIVGIALISVCVIATQSRSQQGHAEDPGRGSAAEPPANAERNAALEKALSGATLAGHFTIEGRNEDKPREERYELGEVKHVDGDQWLISARIKYGENDVTLPLMLPIRWSDDKTAVITVEEMSFPGLGTYSARVMIYGDHYAGYWSAKDHGGHLFGKLEHAKAEDKKDAKEAPAAK